MLIGDILSEFIRGVVSGLRIVVKPSGALELTFEGSRRRTAEKRELLEERLQEGMQALQDASIYMTELQQGIADQKADLEKMRRDYEHFQQLATTERSKADAFIREMANELQASGRRERKWGFVLGVISNLVVAFFLGVFASEPVKAGWNWLWSRF